METSIKGVHKNAFYLKNERPTTKDSLWGRTQGPNMEIFDYKENDDGKVAIIENRE